MNTADSAMITTDITMLHARNIAVGTGELLVTARREFARILKEHNGEWLGASKAGVTQLVERNLIHAREAEDLNTICDLAFARATKGSVRTPAEVIRELLHRMSLDPACSPVALAIANVASKSFDGEEGETQPGVIARTRISPKQGMIGGAIIGASIGGLFGGFGGAAIGIGVGAIVGGTVGVCDTANP